VKINKILRRKMLNQFKRLAAAMVIACLWLGCAGSMQSMQHFETMERKAGEGESEIVVSRPSKFAGALAEMRIVVDGQDRLRLHNGESGTVVVPDGRHTVYANVPMASIDAGSKRAHTVDVAGSRAVFKAEYDFWKSDDLVWKAALLSKYMEAPIGGSAIPPAENNSYNAPTPKPAIASSGQGLSKIAVYVTGDVQNNEKEALGTRMLASLVNSGRYIAIERTNAFLAEIDKEQIRQRSGAIDDSQISRLGRQFGVEFVCIAAITPAFGEFQVSARIVDVETAQVVFIGESASQLKSMADLARVSDQVVQNMFGEESVNVRKHASNPAQKPVTASASAPMPAPEVSEKPGNKSRRLDKRISIELGYLVDFTSVDYSRISYDAGGMALGAKFYVDLIYAEINSCILSVDQIAVQNVDILGKYPVGIGIVNVYPLLGYSMSLLAESVSSRYSHSVGYADYKFTLGGRVDLGLGRYYYLSAEYLYGVGGNSSSQSFKTSLGYDLGGKRWFLRSEALYHYTSTVYNYGALATGTPDSNPYDDTKISMSSPGLYLGVGYKFGSSKR